MKGHFVIISNFAVLIFHFNYFIHETPQKVLKTGPINMSLTSQKSSGHFKTISCSMLENGFRKKGIKRGATKWNETTESMKLNDSVANTIKNYYRN